MEGLFVLNAGARQSIIKPQKMECLFIIAPNVQSIKNTAYSMIYHLRFLKIAKLALIIFALYLS